MLPNSHPSLLLLVREAGKLMLGGVVLFITERGRRAAGGGLLRPFRVFNKPFNMLKNNT